MGRGRSLKKHGDDLPRNFATSHAKCFFLVPNVALQSVEKDSGRFQQSLRERGRRYGRKGICPPPLVFEMDNIPSLLYTLALQGKNAPL